ncbi:MAG TPA: glycosyltransferase family 2 protein [Patescibacteria group bacterium]|nr:glycosyltransferase family 2 protein [Patescibacteria group bacterium]
MKLSVVLAVRNEEANLANCLESIKAIADEIVIVDEHSTDKTVEIAKKFKARVYEEPHHEIFHITKQKALDYAKGEWILQLDADEIITSELREEIEKIIKADNLELDEKTEAKFNDPKNSKKAKLFLRHQRILEQRDGSVDVMNGEIAAFFIPRVNLFLGKPLIHAGVYPDPAIRLVRKGKAHFGLKSVHDIMQIDGRVSWLFNDMLHNDSPTLNKYVMRLNRYTDLHAEELKEKHAPKNLLYLAYYSFYNFVIKFSTLWLRHKGYEDGIRGFLWSMFSAWHFPIAYFKYWTGDNL